MVRAKNKFWEDLDPKHRNNPVNVELLKSEITKKKITQIVLNTNEENFKKW